MKWITVQTRDLSKSFVLNKKVNSISLLYFSFFFLPRFPIPFIIPPFTFFTSYSTLAFGLFVARGRKRVRV